jgi:hypothetical protein
MRQHCRAKRLHPFRRFAPSLTWYLGLDEFGEQEERFLPTEIARLTDHPRAKAQGALQQLVTRATTLRIADWVELTLEERTITLTVQTHAQQAAAQLDGCSGLKTDLTPHQAPKELVHDRYKDLASVERAFRTCTTTHLAVRPIFLRREARTRAHALVVMLGLNKDSRKNGHSLSERCNGVVVGL